MKIIYTYIYSPKLYIYIICRKLSRKISWVYFRADSRLIFKYEYIWGKWNRLGPRSKFLENILLYGVYLYVGQSVLCSKLFC